MDKAPLYQALAFKLLARETCRKIGNDEWARRHTEEAMQLARQYMPSGSGFDVGTVLDSDKSTPNRLVFHTSYHHMNDGGFYTKWTDHTITVLPSLCHGIGDMKITTGGLRGFDKNLWITYAHDVFFDALMAEVDLVEALP